MTEHLNERGRGWLRHIWEKATTPDDWSSSGTPHPWWDRESTAPMCSFPRFDLNETSYVLPVLANLTPAWREAYTAIAEGLITRYTSFWAAADWLTLIGPDPNVDRYPPAWLGLAPEHLRGRYPLPGWTGNGIEPWGLQPDPIGSDGNLFFRGFFNLLLSVYRSISGDQRWERPFEVTGYRDRRFSWTHHQITELMESQFRSQPQGPHCENTKIWPYCVSAAGLGLQLYDSVHSSDRHACFGQWLEYAKRHYMSTKRSGELDWFALYYDPVAQALCAVPGPASAVSALAVTPYLLPQDPQFTTQLYELALANLGWSDHSKPLLQLLDDPRGLSIALFIANELGDGALTERLRAVAERDFEPRFFGPDGDRFGWWFGFGEEYPRGQPGALLALSEIGTQGSWRRVFNEPTEARFSEPTVEGVDYPTLGIAQACNNESERTLVVETYAATSANRGQASSFRVSMLADPASVTITCDGEDFANWRVTGTDEIELKIDVAEHVFRILKSSTQPVSRRDSKLVPGEAEPAVKGTPTGDAMPAPMPPPIGGMSSMCCCC